ncbi:hypothetical protein B0H15DRAFT_848363 [Mycena belliarum]|uniref:Uncharacterized protein n=1 Tax=Mycena belliarum TaxID=1033014 RepID=A0AAD6U4M8_9AGAR|nr:hypothetical protein B0H15DRAFT_848363 [Mycena belliae]
MTERASIVSNGVGGSVSTLQISLARGSSMCLSSTALTRQSGPQKDDMHVAQVKSQAHPLRNAGVAQVPPLACHMHIDTRDFAVCCAYVACSGRFALPGTRNAMCSAAFFSCSYSRCALPAPLWRQLTRATWKRTRVCTTSQAYVGSWWTRKRRRREALRLQGRRGSALSSACSSGKTDRWCGRHRRVGRSCPSSSDAETRVLSFLALVFCKGGSEEWTGCSVLTAVVYLSDNRDSSPVCYCTSRRCKLDFDTAQWTVWSLGITYHIESVMALLVAF